MRTPYQIVHNKQLSCPICSDGFSYPERFISNVLDELSISYITQYKDVWTQNYRYDFMFTYLNHQYIIETDGGIGHGHSSMTGEDPSISLMTDKIKDDLAIQNGFIVLRIDCNYEYRDRFEYIKNNCIFVLSTIFDLTNVDFDKCNKKSLSSKFKETIDCYINQTKYVNEIANIVKIKPRTVKKYLSSAMNYGILEKTIIITDRITSVNAIGDDGLSLHGKIVYCYEDDLYFNSMKECSEHYGYNVNSFRYALKTNEDGLHKGRHFCLIENIDKNKKLKNKQLKMDNIYQYTKNYELVNIYHGADNLPSDYRYASIVKGCIGSRKTVYGYIWSYKEINHLESA